MVSGARLAPAAAALVLAGCGASGYGHDVKGFTQQAQAPAEQGVLRSIATYRTTADERLACSLITPAFLRKRFEGKLRVCEAVARTADKRELPERAEVQSLAGAAARVRVKEPTPVSAIYSMRLEDGTWRIDDITDAP